MKNIFKTFVRKSEYVRPHGTLRRISEDNIEMVVEIECEEFDWIELTQNGVQWYTFIYIMVKLRVI
jgi:hypothetical protein